MKNILIIILLCAIVKVEAQTSAFADLDSLLEIGRYKIALTRLKKMPSSYSTNYKTATIYETLDLHKKASEFYKNSLTFKNNYKAKLKLAKSLKKEKKYNKSILLFEELSKKDKNNLLSKYELGKLYLLTKQGEKAKLVFKELILQDTKNANYSYKLAMTYTLLKKRNLKINSFLDTYRKDSTHIRAIEQLARAFTKLNDKDSATLFIDKGLQLNKNQIVLNRLKINALYKNKNYIKSIKLLERIDSLAPKEHYTKKMLGKCYYHTKAYEKAIKNFKHATKLNNDDFKSHTYLGDIYLKQSAIEKAMFSYTTATFIGKEARDKEHMGLAAVYTEMKLPNRVLEQYKLATKENYKNYVAHFELAKLSDNYYEDKKIGYHLFKKYETQFKGKNKEYDVFVASKIKEIKKIYFKNGEVLE